MKFQTRNPFGRFANTDLVKESAAYANKTNRELKDPIVSARLPSLLSPGSVPPVGNARWRVCYARSASRNVPDFQVIKPPRNTDIVIAEPRGFGEVSE